MSGEAATGTTRRFYKAVTIGPHQGGFVVHLDGRPLRTPAKRLQVLPTPAAAQLVASEFEAQAERIDPPSMPVTRLVNSAIDGVVGQEAVVAASIAKYADGDLVCYRADFPEPLRQRQAETWDPILAWFRDNHGAEFIVTTGIVAVEQPAAARGLVLSLVAAADPFTLAAIHELTTLSGSVLIALALAAGHLDVEVAWEIAHVDEDWQISRWGEDGEAAARREARWRDFTAAAKLLRALAGAPNG